MKTRILTLLTTMQTFIAVFLFFGIVINAQEPDYLDLALVQQKQHFAQKARVPILETEPREGVDYLKDVYFVAGVTVDCTNCSLSSKYQVLTWSKKLGTDGIELWFDALFQNKKSCNIKIKKMYIKRNSAKSVRLKCGLELNITFPSTPTGGDSTLL